MNRRGIVHLSTVHRTRDNRIYNKECAALVEQGHDLTLVIRAERDETAPVPIRALPTPPNRLHRLTLTQVRAWRTLNELRPALLHIHDPELIPLAWAWARTHGARWIYDAHEDLVGQIDTKPYLNRWQRPLARAWARLLTGWADRHADAIVAATTPVASRYRNPRTRVVYNYPWLRDFTADPAPVPGRLVYVGDLSEERKLSFMIDLTHGVRRVVPHAHLVLAGKLVGAAARRAADRFDGEVVRHLGLLPPTEVPAVIATAQAGLIMLEPLPNYVHSLPTKLFEYMAAGVPFVASDFAYWREVFAGYDAGVFVGTEHLGPAVAEVAALLTDPPRCADLGRRGRAAVEQHHAFESQAGVLASVVASLGLDAAGAPPPGG